MWIFKKELKQILKNSNLLCVFLFFLFLYLTGFLKNIDHFWFDFMIKNYSPVRDKDNSIVLIEIKEDSYDKLGITQPAPRKIFAEFIRKLKKFGAKTIVFDIFLGSTGDINGEQELLFESEKDGNVIHAIYFANTPFEKLFIPLQKKEEERVAKIGGYINFLHGSDKIREVKLAKNYNDKTFFHIAVRAVSGYLKEEIKIDKNENLKIGALRVPHSNKKIYINYYRPNPSKIFSSYPFEDFMNGKVSPEVFKDKIVVFGTAIPIFQDFHLTPAGIMAGYAIQATIIKNILEGDYLLTMPEFSIVFFSFLLFLLFLLRLSGRRKISETMLTGIFFISVTFLLSYFLYIFNKILFPASLSSLSMIASASILSLLQARATEEENRLYNELLEANNQLKEAQAQIVQSSKMAAVGQMAAGIAHEINTPLGTILTSIEILEKKVPEAEQRIAFLARESILKCKTIIERLLYFSRPPKSSEEKIDINKVLDDTLLLLENQLHKEKITFIKEYEELPPVNISSAELYQVATNLLLNAKDAILEKLKKDLFSPQIKLKTFIESQAIVISIEDNGIGIPSENLEKLFEPFFTTKDVGKGTGLGLSVSLGLVKNWGGVIDVDSEEGKWSRFTVRLPCSSDVL